MTITNRVSLKSVNGGNTPIADVVDAPTIGTATAGTESATVAYTAATRGGAATSFTAISTPGSVTGTGSSPITVSGLTGGTAYTFKVYGTNAAGAWSGVQSEASNSVTPTVATAFESIATATVSSSSNFVEFTSIPSTYTHLQIRGISRSTDSSQFFCQFNGDTSANYTFHGMNANGSSQEPYGIGSQTSLQIGKSNYFASATTMFGVGICDIFDYKNTNKYKTVKVLAGNETNGTAGQNVGLMSGVWINTSAITSIKIFPSSPPFTQYSHFALYGIKG